jgi:hypothetical protein
VRDRRAAELGHALDGVTARYEVDRDGVGLARDRERRRFARLVHERLEMRSCDAPEVEAKQYEVGEMHEPDARPVPPRLGHVLGVARLDERAELSRDRARSRTEAPRDFVRAERSLGGEEVEDRECALRRGDTFA